MNKRRWLFVTAPFIVFTIYSFVVSSAYPEAPGRMRMLVSIFLVFTLLLSLAQRALKDDNYFIPTIVMVLFVNFIVIYSVDLNKFDNLESVAPALRLLLERPQLILYFGLCMMALVPPILWSGSFTCYFSRLDYPEEDWKTPDFIRINKNISFFWVFLFILCFATQFIPILIVQLLAPILIVSTLGAYGTKRLINMFVGRLEAQEERKVYE